MVADVVAAEAFAVIGRDDDERALQPAVVIEAIEEAADLGVDVMRLGEELAEVARLSRRRGDALGGGTRVVGPVRVEVVQPQIVQLAIVLAEIVERAVGDGSRVGFALNVRQRRRDRDLRVERLLVGLQVQDAEAGDDFAHVLIVVTEHRRRQDAGRGEARRHRQRAIAGALHERQRQVGARPGGVQAREDDAAARILRQPWHHRRRERVGRQAVDGDEQRQIDLSAREIGIAERRPKAAIGVIGIGGERLAVAVHVAADGVFARQRIARGIEVVAVAAPGDGREAVAVEVDESPQRAREARHVFGVRDGAGAPAGTDARREVGDSKRRRDEDDDGDSQLGDRRARQPAAQRRDGGEEPAGGEQAGDIVKIAILVARRRDVEDDRAGCDDERQHARPATASARQQPHDEEGSGDARDHHVGARPATLAIDHP